MPRLLTPSLRFPLLAALALGLMLWLADISGPFPINDGWAFSLPVRWLARDGVLRFTNWQYPTLIGQTLIGAGWSLLFGYSETSLRVLSAVVAWGGMVAHHRLLRMCRLPRGWATAVTLSIALSPLFVPEIGSFMTDIWCWSLMLISLALLLAGLEREQRSLMLAGWAVAFVALSVRQLAIAIPFAFMVADWMRGTSLRRVALRGGVPLALMIAAFAGYSRALTLTIGQPVTFREPTEHLRLIATALAHFRFGALLPIVHGIADGGVYLGLLGLPVAAMLLLSPRLRPSLPPVVGLAVLWLAIAWMRGRPIPVPGNTIQRWGLGPRTLIDMNPAGVGPGWWLLTAVACIAFATLFVAAATRLRRERALIRSRWREGAILTMAAVAYAPLIIMFGPWLDRHVVVGGSFAVTGLAAVALGGRTFAFPRAGVAIVVATIALSTLLLHDYMAWSRSRWTAAELLTAKAGVPRRAIDGGFEWDSLAQHSEDPHAPIPLNGRLWRDPGAPCRLTENHAPAGSLTLVQVPVDRWLPVGGAVIVGSCR